MDGVLVVDKPSRLTSHDVVGAARRVLGDRRIGHTGTLDPLATGVLPLVRGRATRLVRFLAPADKEYDATIRFGLTTDTYDITGATLTRTDRQPDSGLMRQALDAFLGEYLQTPPPFSAKKTGGRRAYALARRQAVVDLRPVPVRVTSLTILATGERTARVAIRCSAGFYVRAFVHAWGAAVGTGACLEALRRTRSGQFGLESAVTLDGLVGDPHAAAARMIPLEALLPSFPQARVTDDLRRKVAHGQDVEAKADLPPGDWIRLVDEDGRLVAVATRGSRPGFLHPAVVLT
jgi:tRNA pseudouridine55 synthase